MVHKQKERIGWKYASGVYRRFTLVHFAYALVLTVPLALVLLALDLDLALMGLVIAEIIAFAALPHFGWVRRMIDARIEARARLEAAMVRSVLLLRMSEEHRRELASLEAIASALRERTQITEDPQTAGLVEDCLGVERLIELYVRLAIAHRSSRTSLEVVGRSRPDDEIALLEAVVASEGCHPWIDRRLRILRMRRDARRAAVEEQVAIDRDLTMIGHTIRWMQEHAAAPGVEALHSELEVAFAGRDRDAATLRELSTLRASDFDGTVIRLGRDVTVNGEVAQLSHHHQHQQQQQQTSIRIAPMGGEPCEAEEGIRIIAAALSSSA